MNIFHQNYVFKRAVIYFIIFPFTYSIWEIPTISRNSFHYPSQFPSQYLAQHPSQYPSQYRSQYPSKIQSVTPPWVPTIISSHASPYPTHPDSSSRLSFQIESSSFEIYLSTLKIFWNETLSKSADNVAYLIISESDDLLQNLMFPKQNGVSVTFLTKMTYQFFLYSPELGNEKTSNASNAHSSHFSLSVRMKKFMNVSYARATNYGYFEQVKNESAAFLDERIEDFFHKNALLSVMQKKYPSFHSVQAIEYRGQVEFHSLSFKNGYGLKKNYRNPAYNLFFIAGAGTTFVFIVVIFLFFSGQKQSSVTKQPSTSLSGIETTLSAGSNHSYSTNYSDNSRIKRKYESSKPQGRLSQLPLPSPTTPRANSPIRKSGAFRSKSPTSSGSKNCNVAFPPLSRRPPVTSLSLSDKSRIKSTLTVGSSCSNSTSYTETKRIKKKDNISISQEKPSYPHLPRAAVSRANSPIRKGLSSFRSESLKSLTSENRIIDLALLPRSPTAVKEFPKSILKSNSNSAQKIMKVETRARKIKSIEDVKFIPTISRSTTNPMKKATPFKYPLRKSLISRSFVRSSRSHMVRTTSLRSNSPKTRRLSPSRSKSPTAFISATSSRDQISSPRKYSNLNEKFTDIPQKKAKRIGSMKTDKSIGSLKRDVEDQTALSRFQAMPISKAMSLKSPSKKFKTLRSSRSYIPTLVKSQPNSQSVKELSAYRSKSLYVTEPTPRNVNLRSSSRIQTIPSKKRSDLNVIRKNKLNLVELQNKDVEYMKSVVDKISFLLNNRSEEEILADGV